MSLDQQYLGNWWEFTVIRIQVEPGKWTQRSREKWQVRDTPCLAEHLTIFDPKTLSAQTSDPKTLSALTST
jgi:hypothetical protein